VGPGSECLNCGATLAPEDGFCRRCGQKAATHRLTLHDIGHDLWHAVTHTDRSVLSLVRELLLRPGIVARRYCDGHRKAYFNPFSFLIVVVGIASIAQASSLIVDFNQGARSNPVSSFLQRNFNLVVLFQVPLLALMCRWLFRSARQHYAEHLVLAAYTSGLRSVFFTIVVAPAWILFHRGQGILLLAYLGLWSLYFAYACSQFHPGPRWSSALRGLIAAMLSQAIVTGFITAAIWANFIIRYG
jgi:Protein of unknown function (DUF3667)